MKTTKIAPGYYTFQYNGVTVKIIYTDDVKDYKYWCYTMNDGDANDVYSTKKIAIIAAIDFIDNYMDK